MFTKLNEFLNNVDLRKMMFSMLMVIIILGVWNCYLSCKLQVVEGMSATTPNAAIQNLAKLSSYITADGNSFKIPGNLTIEGELVMKDKIVMNGSTIHFRDAADTNHSIGYNSAVDGPEIKGYAGVKLTTTSDNGSIVLDKNTIVNGDLTLKTNDKSVTLRSAGDKNNILQMRNAPCIDKHPAGGYLTCYWQGGNWEHWRANDLGVTIMDGGMKGVRGTKKIESVSQCVKYRIKMSSGDTWSNWIYGPEDKHGGTGHNEQSVMYPGKKLPGLSGYFMQGDLRAIEIRLKNYLNLGSI